MTTINETSRLGKAKQALFGANTHVKNFCIITANNPIYAKDSSNNSTMTPEENKKLNDELITFLGQSGFRFYKVLGKFKNDEEKSFIIYNIPLNFCMYLGRKFDQRSFIYAENNEAERRVDFYYYEKENSERDDVKEKNKTYYLIDEFSKANILDSDTADNFTGIGKKFKFTIPFPIFNEGCDDLNRLVNSRCENFPKYKQIFEDTLKTSIAPHANPREQRRAMAILYGEHFQKFLHED